MSGYKTDPQITHALIDGAYGNIAYFWWKDVRTDHMFLGSDDVPADWAYTFTAVHQQDEGEDKPDEFEPVEFEVNHRRVVQLVDQVLAGHFGRNLPEGTSPVSQKTVDACRMLIEDPEFGYLSWDHWLADELLQLGAYGGVVF